MIHTYEKLKAEALNAIASKDSDKAHEVIGRISMAYELDHLYSYQQAELTDMLEDAIALWRSEHEGN